MIANVRPTVKLRSLRNRLLGQLVLIACVSLLGASTARAGFFNNLLNQAENKAVQTIKHDLRNQPASQPAPANPQPATTPNSPTSQPASQPAPAIPQPVVTRSSPANQAPAASSSGTQSASVSSAAAAANPGPVAVAQKVVGPFLTGTDRSVSDAPAYTVSLHGSHLATAHMQGSRYVVTVDDVTGPRVDAVLPTYARLVNSGGTAQAVAMSDDGRHHAYLARKRGKLEVIEDGKQILQFPRHGVIRSDVCYLFFSPHGGAHLFFAAVSSNSEEMELWVDGKPVPSFANGSNDSFTFTFSPDGKHYLYAGLPEDRSPKNILVVDGRKVGYALSGLLFGPAPQFTADSRHVLCVVQRSVGQKTVESVLLDGKPVVTGDQIDRIVTAPRGSSFAAVVQDHNNTHSAVYLNGTEVPFTRFAGYINSVPLFSPDGKHLAVACNYGAGNAYVVLDGKQGDTYDKIHAASDLSAMKFSADSQSFGYFADAGSKTFAVVNGHEYDPGFDGEGQIYFSPEGHHVAVFEGQVLYVDGKRVSTASGGGHFAFDRDGSHWMIYSPGGSNVVVDGRSLPLSVAPWDEYTNMGKGRVTCRFSPDGSELAVAGNYLNQPAGLFLYNTSTKRIRRLTSGLILGTGDFQRPYTLIFSPDSKHLYYARQQNAGAIIYVDGEKTAVQFKWGLHVPWTVGAALPPAQGAGCWYVGADDKLHALCAVGNKVVRYVITPPSGGLM